VTIEVVNRQRLSRVDRDRLAELASETLSALGRANAEVTLVLVRDPAIRKLNRRFRGKDTATDVLSFPASDQREENAAVVERESLGDVVISTDTAVKQARDAGYSLERELSELVIHGVLHLCGYDHENDNGKMNRVELRLRRKLLDEE
jgi:probable rRNA maturation factor